MPNDFDFLAAVGLCACGKPLHYSDPELAAQVLALMAPSATVIVTGPDGARYEVQRHYIAIHGLRAIDLHQLEREQIIKRLPPVTGSQGREK